VLFDLKIRKSLIVFLMNNAEAVEDGAMINKSPDITTRY